MTTKNVQLKNIAGDLINPKTTADLVDGLPEYTVEAQLVPETGYVATFLLMKDGAVTGAKINIPAGTNFTETGSTVEIDI